MSLIGSFATEAGPLLFTDWGEAVQYLRDGTSRSITAAVIRGTTRQEDRNGHKYLIRTAEVQVYDDSSTGVSDPTHGDGLITSDGVVWDLQTVTDRNGGFIIMDFESAEIAETGQPTITDA